jgi:undecaprenyl pyrophosphate synthase
MAFDIVRHSSEIGVPTISLFAFSKDKTLLSAPAARRAYLTFIYGKRLALKFTSKKLWPDFTSDDFDTHITQYMKTERRFGKTSTQLKLG